MEEMFNNMNIQATPVTPSGDQGYMMAPGKLLELGEKVTVYSNYQEGLIILPKSITPDIDFSLITPCQMIPPSLTQELILNDVFFDDTLNLDSIDLNANSSDMLTSSEIDLIDIIDHYEQKVSCVQTRRSKQSL